MHLPCLIAHHGSLDLCSYRKQAGSCLGMEVPFLDVTPASNCANTHCYLTCTALQSLLTATPDCRWDCQWHPAAQQQWDGCGGHYRDCSVQRSWRRAGLLHLHGPNPCRCARAAHSSCWEAHCAPFLEQWFPPVQVRPACLLVVQVTACPDCHGVPALWPQLPPVCLARHSLLKCINAQSATHFDVMQQCNHGHCARATVSGKMCCKCSGTCSRHPAAQPCR